MSAPALTRPTAPPRAEPYAGLPDNAIGRRKSTLEIVTLYVIVLVPFLALAAVVPAVWGWGISWLDVGLAVGFYYLSLLGVTVGFHRHFTHGSFKSNRGLKIALAVAGSMAIQEAAKHLDAKPAQVALAWLLKRSPVMLPIPGTSTVAHLEDNLAAATLQLSDDEFARLTDAVS